MNALTTPQSYTVRFMPHQTYGYDELAAEMARDNPLWDAAQIKAMLISRDQTIKRLLINGCQVTLKDAFSYRLSFHARLENPDDPLPPIEEMLRVKISASRIFVGEVGQEAQLERRPSAEKLPVVASAKDTVLGLHDVLNPSGALRLSGSDLAFHQEAADEGCILEGTRSGKTVQRRLVSVSDTEIIFMPDIPAQPDPWNNEYSLTVVTRYTEHGSLRSGLCRRMLRAPLAVTLGNAAGVLSDGGASPLVLVTGGTLGAASARVRIQAVLDAQDGGLRLSLLDMKENGAVGNAVLVSANGTCTLSGYPGSDLSSLTVEVSKFAQLVKLVRSPYGNRLVDILDISQGA